VYDNAVYTVFRVFDISFGTGRNEDNTKADLPLHIRYNSGEGKDTITLNYRKNGAWDYENTYTVTPLKANDTFEVTVGHNERPL